MLVTTTLSSCPTCADTASLIGELDCFISGNAFRLLQISRFGFRRAVNTAMLKDALRYKRILTARTVNPLYAAPFDMDAITSIVKQITFS